MNNTESLQNLKSASKYRKNLLLRTILSLSFGNSDPVMPREMRIIRSTGKPAIMEGFSYFRHAVVPNLICRLYFMEWLDREPTKRKPTCDTVISNAEDLIKNITTKKTVC